MYCRVTSTESSDTPYTCRADRIMVSTAAVSCFHAGMLLRQYGQVVVYISSTCLPAAGSSPMVGLPAVQRRRLERGHVHAAHGLAARLPKLVLRLLHLA